MSNNINGIILIAVAAVCTFLLRVFPFLVFGGKRKMPNGIKKVVNLMPVAIMSVLVIYCVKADVIKLNDYLIAGKAVNIVSTVASFMSLCVVTIVHLLKRNTLLSILIGTVIYMILIRLGL